METRYPGQSSHRSSAVPLVSRRTALQGAALAGASLALLAAGKSLVAPVWAAQAGPPEEWFTEGATTDRHGQVILGGGPVYLSHLPFFMFDPPDHHPHHYQTILEVRLPDDAMEAYLEDRADFETPPLYTFHPTTFVSMLDLILPAGGGATPPPLTGKIIRGHWERDTEPQPFGVPFHEVHAAVPVAVEHVIYAHEFAFDPPPQEQLEYILFGAGEERFLAHRITAPPDFDQLLPVTMEPGTFSDEQLQSGIILSIPERANAIADRLMDGDAVTAAARHAGTGVALGTAIPITAGQEIFFEESELQENGFLGHTQIEIDAGFGVPEDA
jgi:hypothetical protein